MVNDNKLAMIRQLVEAAQNNLETATQLLGSLGAGSSDMPGLKTHVGGSVQHTEQGAVIIEGVFDGQNMVGPDGKLYSVPANYASKSKLVEGDLLKLTISPDGSFIYKQIGPVERDRVVGILAHDAETDEYRVLAKGKFLKILLASITYFKADVGDEVVVLVPKGTMSTWAAVENVMKKDGTTGEVVPIEATSDASHTPASFELTPKSAPAPVRRGPGRPRKNPLPAEVPASVAHESAQPAPPPGIDF